MEQDKIAYQNNRIIITELPRKKDFGIEEVNRKDHRYRIKIIGESQPEIEDAGKLVYFLLKNIVIENEFYRCKDIIVDAIFKAEYERSYPENLEEP